MGCVIWVKIASLVLVIVIPVVETARVMRLRMRLVEPAPMTVDSVAATVRAVQLMGRLVPIA